MGEDCFSGNGVRLNGAPDPSPLCRERRERERIVGAEEAVLCYMPVRI